MMEMGRSPITRPTSDASGRVVDGRDGWLSSIAYHAVHDALDAGEPLDVERLARQVWDRFEASTDLSRPRKDGPRAWASEDAAQKVANTPSGISVSSGNTAKSR